MTKDELEKLGYEFGSEDTAGGHTYHSVCKEDVAGFLTYFDSHKSGDEGLQECLQAATAHYLQRLELETLREFVKDVKLYNAKAEYHPYSWLDWMKLKIMGIDAWYESAKATRTDDQ